MKHTTVEFYLNQLVSKELFETLPADQAILMSIARQVNRGIALTDRQYELVKQKLVLYRDQFIQHNMTELDQALETLAMPLRTIDRSQTVTVEENEIVVKFPFNKKIIAQLDKISSKYRQFYSHEKNSNRHRFKLYEPLISEIVNLFNQKSFHIDPLLKAVSDEIDLIKIAEQQYVPHIGDDGLKNLPAAAVAAVEADIGVFSTQNNIKYWDRSIRYGYRKTARMFKGHSAVTEYVANRTESKIYISPFAYPIREIPSTIKTLDRFPLLVTLSRNKEYAELKQLCELFDFVDPQQQIMLDRIDDKNNENYQLNSYIKQKGFSTWLDNNIKIVYIFKNSLPKLFFRNHWQPLTHLSLGGERETSVTAAYIEQHCDLSLIYDSQKSYWDNPTSRQLNQWV